MDWVREMLVDTEEIDQYWEEKEYQQRVREEANRIYYETYPDRVPEPAPVILENEGSVFLVKAIFMLVIGIIVVGAFKGGNNA